LLLFCTEAVEPSAIVLRPFNAIAPGKSWPLLPALGKSDFIYCAGAICCHCAAVTNSFCDDSCAEPFAIYCNRTKGFPLLLAHGHLPPSRWVLEHSHFLVPKPINAIVPRLTILIVVPHAAPRSTFAHLASNILQIASTHFSIMELHYYGYATVNIGLVESPFQHTCL
jgi:hypothetical protein